MRRKNFVVAVFAIVLVSFGIALATCVLIVDFSKISKENYDNIKVGMTQAEVVGILGQPKWQTLGQPIWSKKSAMPGIIETWEFYNIGYGRKPWMGGVIWLVFQNGRVSEKMGF